MKPGIIALMALALLCSCSCRSVPDKPNAAWIYGAEPRDPEGEDFELHLESPEPAQPPEVKGNKVYLYFNNHIDPETAKEFIDALATVDGPGEAKAVVLEIDSEGGQLDSGFDMIKAIERSRLPVHCVVDGQADSMAFYLLQSCKTRIMTKRSVLMMHQASISGMVNGNSEYWLAYGHQLKALDNALLEHAAARMGMKVADLKKKIEGGGQWWMNWDEAQKSKAVDHVVNNVDEADKLLPVK